MSPVFRHGRLRLYLLKLLDDAPKHGYEVIRLLQDRFMGVYAPSPGTIYPRLARLEEEGLVTHDEVEGRKVYRLTDKGRQEIEDRMDDLAELEEEITESVRDIAREVKEDVRETVRSLREEIAKAARDVHREGERAAREEARDTAGPARGEAGESARSARAEAREEARRVRDEARQERDEAHREKDQGHWERDRAHGERDQARRERGPRRKGGDEWGQAADEPWPGHEAPGGREQGYTGRGPHAARERAGEEAGARFRAGRGRSRKDWGDWSGLRDWPGWRDWPGLKDWRDWPGSGSGSGGRDWPGAGRGNWPDPAAFRDLERVALGFASDLRRLASQASAVGEDTFGNLRDILDEALGRIRTEVFKPAAGQGEGADEGGTEPGAGAGQPAPDGDAAEGAAAAEAGGEPGESGPAAEAGGAPGDSPTDRTTE